MRRTTVSLPDDLAALVEREASRRNISVSELMRLALSSLLRPEGDRHIPWAGMVREPEMVYGADLDDALAEESSRDGASDGRAGPKQQRSKKGAVNARTRDRR